DRERNAHDAVRPVVAVHGEAQRLQYRPRGGDIRQRPLHQLALPEAREESCRKLVHRVAACAGTVAEAARRAATSAGVGNPTFLQNTAKRGSSWRAVRSMGAS